MEVEEEVKEGWCRWLEYMEGGSVYMLDRSSMFIVRYVVIWCWCKDK